MNHFYTNCRLIFFPYLIIAFGTIGLYTFLNWLLLIKLHFFIIDEDVVVFFVPIAFSWVPLLIWLRPRIKWLTLKTNSRNDPVAGILFLNWISIVVPLIIGQFYLVTATGKLTRLENIAQIKSFPPTKYYRAKHFYVNKRLVHVKSTFTVSGKNNSDFNITIYAPVPVFAHVFPDTNRIAEILNHVNIKALFILNGKFSTKQQIKKIPADSILRMRYLNPTMVMPRYGDTGKYGAVGVITKGYKMKDTLTVIKIDPIAWLAVKYRKTISNNLSVQEKKRRFKEFAIQSETDFKYKKLNSFVYLNRIPNNKDLKNYNAAIRLRGDVADGEQVILEPVYEPFEVRNGNKLAWILGYFGTGTLIFLLILYLVRPKHSTGIIE